MIFMMNGGPVFWKSKLQTLVTLSSCEAELVALCDTAKVGVWIRALLGTIDPLTLEKPLVICEDNSAALACAKSGVRKPRNRHINIRHFWIHEKEQSGELLVTKVKTTDMLADMFTKALGTELFVKFRTEAGVVPVC